MRAHRDSKTMQQPIDDNQVKYDASDNGHGTIKSMSDRTGNDGMNTPRNSEMNKAEDAEIIPVDAAAMKHVENDSIICQKNDPLTSYEDDSMSSNEMDDNKDANMSPDEDDSVSPDEDNSVSPDEDANMKGIEDAEAIRSEVAHMDSIDDAEKIHVEGADVIDVAESDVILLENDEEILFPALSAEVEQPEDNREYDDEEEEDARENENEDEEDDDDEDGEEGDENEYDDEEENENYEEDSSTYDSEDIETDEDDSASTIVTKSIWDVSIWDDWMISDEDDDSGSAVSEFLEDLPPVESNSLEFQRSASTWNKLEVSSKTRNSPMCNGTLPGLSKADIACVYSVLECMDRHETGTVSIEEIRKICDTMDADIDVNHLLSNIGIHDYDGRLNFTELMTAFSKYDTLTKAMNAAGESETNELARQILCIPPSPLTLPSKPSTDMEASRNEHDSTSDIHQQVNEKREGVRRQNGGHDRDSLNR